MTIETILREFYGVYNSTISYMHHNRTPNDVYTNFEENNVFRRFLRVSIDGEGNFELPLLGLRNTIGTIINTVKNAATIEKVYNKDFVLPINSYEPGFHSHLGNTYKTAQSLFYNLISASASFGGVCKVLYDKNGVKYYGAKGVIFNKDWEPLICITLRAKVKYIQLRNEEPYPQIKIFGLNCYIEPSVITSKGTIEKFIVSKVLPNLCSNKVRMFNRALNYNDTFIATPVVIIKEYGCSKFFSAVEEPEIIINNSINNFLINNISDISEDFLPES